MFVFVGFLYTRKMLRRHLDIKKLWTGKETKKKENYIDMDLEKYVKSLNNSGRRHNIVNFCGKHTQFLLTLATTLILKRPKEIKKKGQIRHLRSRLKSAPIYLIFLFQ